MVFFNFNKTLELTAYTCRPEVFNYAPIVKATKLLPKWVAKCPVEAEVALQFNSPLKANVGTIKRCVGLTEHYKRGVVLPLWTDIMTHVGAIDSNQDSFHYSSLDGITQVVAHHPEQFGGGIDLSGLQHIKIHSPWLFVSNKNVSFWSVDLPWNFLETPPPLRILPGVLNFSKQHASHINMMLYRQEAALNLTLPYGMPLYHYVPLYDGPFKLNVELISEEQFKRLDTKSRSLTRDNYRKVASTIVSDNYVYENTK
jgi:hypothetical protein